MRLEIMRRTDLALRAVRELESTDDRLTAAALAGRLGSTRQFIPQVMNPLVRSGWVSSEPGPRGGYRLVESLAERTMLEFIELIEGRVENERCVLRAGPCDGAELCALHEAWMTARTALVERLGAMPVSGPTLDKGEEQ